MHDAEAIFLCFFNVSPGPKLIRACYVVDQKLESFVGLRIPARPATPKTRFGSCDKEGGGGDGGRGRQEGWGRGFKHMSLGGECQNTL